MQPASKQPKTQKVPNSENQKIVMFGGGTFGTAVGTVLARRGHSVAMFVRTKEKAALINKEHRNGDYLKEYTLPNNLTAVATDDKQAVADALQSCDIIFHSVPVQATTDYLSRLASLIPPNVPIVSLSKGIHQDDLNFMCDIINIALNREQPAAFLSGPSFARELMDEQPTGLVIASTSEEIRVRLQAVLMSNVLRVYTSDDVLGVEIGGALKNIYAIAAGFAEGMGYKMNTAALLVTRGCNEMQRLALLLGAKPATLAGLSGVGDLMLTCFGGASRNRTVGVRLGKGEKLKDILESMGEVAEGVPTAAAAVKLTKKYGIHLPIAQAVADVLAGNVDNLKALLISLMTLPAAPEDNYLKN